MQTINKILAIKDILDTLSLENYITLETASAVFLVELPSSIRKTDFDLLCHDINTELIKQKLTLNGDYSIEDLGSLVFRINYPL